MRLIEQFPVKAEWRDAPPHSGILPDAISRNFKQMSPLVYTDMHIYTNQYYQLYLDVKLISLKLFSSSDTKCFLEITFPGADPAFIIRGRPNSEIFPSDLRNIG